jgi:hypothetical protein
MAKSQPRFLAHDADWQYPAITEEHAYRRALESLPEVEGLIYFGFPWATLIDLSWSPEKAAPLQDALARLAAQVRSCSRVVTVCQHVRMLDHLALFESAGVTDIFWSHAARGQKTPSEQTGPRLHPFPLFPVQAFGQDLSESAPSGRPHLFSFVGAKPDKWYLSGVRNWIFEKLEGHPLGYVRSRPEWHYRRAVFRSQIADTEETIGKYLEERHTEEYKRVLRESLFSLCPSGSGSNTLRLWESLAFGAIPVVLSETWLPPGDESLWKRAVVFCEETLEAVEQLPARLEALAADSAGIQNRRKAMEELWRCYGDGDFIYDIRQLWMDLGGIPCTGQTADLHLQSLLDLARLVPNNPRDCDLHAAAFLGGCRLRLALDERKFLMAIRSEDSLAEALRRCEGLPGSRAAKLLCRAGVPK